MDFHDMNVSSLRSIVKKAFTSNEKQCVSVDIWAIADMKDLIKTTIPKDTITYVILTYKHYSSDNDWQRMNEYAFVTSDGSFVSDGPAPILSNAIPQWITQMCCEAIMDEI
jgi:hypothetical protein